MKILPYNARRGFHNATGGNITQTEWSDDRLRVEPSPQGSQKIKLSFPQQIVEEHEHVRDTTHPPKHYGCIYVTRSLYEVTFPMRYRNVGSSCPHYRERRRSPHRTDSDALYAVGGGRMLRRSRCIQIFSLNTGPASIVTTTFTPYYLDTKHRREDTPVFFCASVNASMTQLGGCSKAVKSRRISRIRGVP